jgi:4-methyl-5(b-hydroxyethyl)-thiazole monophosphate biosynthesis
MKIALFYYDGFSEFEIVLIGLLLKDQEIITVALEKREYCSEERQRFVVDSTIHKVDPGSIDLLVIPGGDPAPLVGNLELKNFIGKVLAANKKVAGICGGASLLAGMGFLKGKCCTGMTSGVRPDQPSTAYYAESIVSDKYVVVDGNIITAQGQAYAEFAVELVHQMGLYNNHDEYQLELNWCKNIR